MSELTEESFNTLRQQLVQEHQASPSETDSSLYSPLHAFGVRPHYDWTPDLTTPHFHQNKASLNNELYLVNNLLDTLARRELPKQIHRPTIGISPTLNHLRQIQSTTSTPLPFLQNAAAFLLAMAAFFRPSDIHRIDLQSADINVSFQLTFQVVSPKETRDHRRIIKSFIIFPNQDRSLCPVRALIALSDHPSLSRVPTRSSLFVNSRCPQELLATSTISTWLRHMIRIPTEEQNVSVRSIASSLALRRSVPKEDIVTLGN